MLQKFLHKLPHIPILHQRKIDPNFSRAIGILVVFAAIGAVWFVFAAWKAADIFSNSSGDQAINNSYPPIRGEAFIQFDFGTKPSRAFRGSVIDGMTLSQALQQAAITGNFNVDLNPQPVIDGINDGSEGKHWVFYRNNTRISESPDSVVVKAGDEIFARFE